MGREETPLEHFESKTAAEKETMSFQSISHLFDCFNLVLWVNEKSCHTRPQRHFAETRLDAFM